MKSSTAVARRAALLAFAAAAVFGATSFSPTPPPTRAVGVKPEGLLCTPTSSGDATHPSFVVDARTGTISMPDGNSVVMWSYSADNQPFQYPGPVLCVDQGDTVTVTLRNHLAVRTSMQFMGINSVMVDGHPAQAQFDGANLRSLTNDVAPDASITYTFVADQPGTYLYQSGNDQALQIEMGLVGAVVVRPSLAPAGAAYDALPGAEKPLAALAYNDQATLYSTEHEYMVLLTELDPDVHYAVEEDGVLTSAQYEGAYEARYFMINGRSFPDDIAPNGAAWLPSQPYGALAHVEPYSPANPLPALIRYLAVGGETYPFHPHSNHEKVIAKDGRLLADNGTALFLEKFGIPVEPGSTVDALFQWENVEDYNVEGANLPLPVPKPAPGNLSEGDYWSGSPYLGSNGVLNPEVQGKNSCGEYYHVAHNHNLSEATNYGAAFGGQLTLIRVDPANNATCENG